MRLSKFVIDKLKNNWGDRVDAFECCAEVRMFDPSSTWEAYIMAIDPNDEDTCKAIIVDEYKRIWTIQTNLSYLLERWNGEGELMEIDSSFVRRKASALFKTLKVRFPS